MRIGFAVSFPYCVLNTWKFLTIWIEHTGQNYEQIKQALLLKFKLTHEAHRKEFCGMQKIQEMYA